MHHVTPTSCVASLAPPGAQVFGLSAMGTTPWFFGSSRFTGRAALGAWDGAAFTELAAPIVGPELFAASGTSSKDFWVAGQAGALLRTSVPSPHGNPAH